jgi:heme-degrading monooxygenase HmoA
MSRIIAGKEPITLINVFEVAPARQQELVQLLNEATERVMRRVPGFVSANIHRSLDGKQVVNYAQWQSREAFERMPEFPGTREHMERAAQLATRFSPSLYEVVATHEK